MQTHCSTCGTLRNVESSFYKYGFEQDHEPLPPSILALTEIVSHISGGRGNILYQCPDCKVFFHYNLDYEFIIPGTEDTETLRRISDEEAQALQESIERAK